MQRRDVIVIGSSMGGISALTSLASRLPEDLPAAVFVVQHIAPSSPAFLSRILGDAGPLSSVTAEDGMPLERGRIYVAPPDQHMLITPAGVRVAFGPRENGNRPAIDPLFRTAAVHYRSRVIGVILTGMLGDGAAGLAAVKTCGGLALVQRPDEAEFPEMPRRALAEVSADHEFRLDDLASLLAELTAQEAPDPPEVPPDLLLEARLTEGTMTPSSWDQLPGRPTPYVCPECGGTLRKIDDPKLHRFRCHVGHAFTRSALLNGQQEAIEEALWVAVRTLEERARMLESMSDDEEERGRNQAAASFKQRASEARDHERKVRDFIAVLAAASPDDAPGAG